MNTSSKRIGVYALIGILIISAVAFLPGINLSTLSYSTTLQNFDFKGTGGTSGYQDFSKLKDKVLVKGTSTGTSFVPLLDDTVYVSGWINGQKSEKIQLHGAIDYWSAAYDNPAFWWPGVLLGTYYYKVYFTPSTGGSEIPLIWNGGIASNIVIQSGTYSARKFPNIEGLYQTVWGKYSGSKSWFTYERPAGSNDRISAYVKYPSPLTTDPLLFYMTGPTSGTIRAELWVEFAEIEVDEYGILQANVRYNSHTIKLQEDGAEIKDGEGQVDATSTNSLRGVPGYSTINEEYTSYVYKQGQAVTFSYKVGASGPTSGTTATDKKWKFEIFDPAGAVQKSVYLEDAVSPNTFNQGTIPFTIPVAGTIGSWNFKLTNGLLIQSEGKIFVVDALEKIPGRTTITTDKSEYTIGEQITVTCQANENPNTNLAIAKFDVWAKYGSSTSAIYAFGPGYVTDLQVSSTGTYTGRFSFIPTKIGSIYIRGHAIDTGNRAGAENTPDKLLVIKDIPHYQLTVIAKDGASGVAIGNVVVSFKGVTGQTDAQGSVILSVEGGSGTLTASKVGYTGITRTEAVTSARTLYILLTSTGGGAQDVSIDVYTSGTTDRISGASVTLDTVTKPTDSSGSVTFSAINTASHSLSITKEGYDAISKSINVPSDLTAGRYAIFLNVTGGGDGGEEEEPGGLTYKIIIDIIDSSTSEYVSGATVTVGTQTQVTDEFGSITFDLAADSYSVMVTKDRYQQKTETLDVTESVYHPIYVTSTGGSQQPDGGGTPITYAVTISVLYSGLPVSGAFVQLGNNHMTTGPTGDVIIQASNGDNYLSVSQADYQFYTATISVTSNMSISAPLTKGTIPAPGAKCTVTLTIKNAKDKSLLNGVTVNIGGISKTTSNGIATIEVSQGSQTIMVAKSGFNPFTRAITVNQNMAFTIELIPTGGTTPGTPGFELITLIAAFGIAMILLRKRKKQ